MPKDDPALLEQLVEASRPAASKPTAPFGWRDGHHARHVRPRRLRPGRFLRGRGRAEARDRRQGDRSRATWCSGVASSGLHSNGYSLARKIVFDIAGLEGRRPRGGAGHDRGPRRCSTPTRIYVRPIRQILNYTGQKRRTRHRPYHGRRTVREPGPHRARGRAGGHHRGSWPVPPVSPGWRLGEVEQAEMDQVFNMGMGLVLVVAPFYADSIRQQLKPIRNPVLNDGQVVRA